MGRIEEIQRGLDIVLKDENVQKYIALVVEKEMIEKKIDKLKNEWEELNDDYEDYLGYFNQGIENKIVETEDGYIWERYETEDYKEIKNKCEELWLKRRSVEKKLKELRVEL